jgi:[acyl-carrier-protein] S-malonyltransferase
MLEAGHLRPGKMAAVLGLPGAEVEAACREASSSDEVAVPANFNAPDQTVVSGDPAAVERAGAACQARGARRVVPLKVSGAFHSPLMAPAQDPLAGELAEAPFGDPAVPVMANASAEPVTTAERARVMLVEQLTSPVRWVGCVEAAAEHVGEGATWIEMGPGTVLTGLLKRIVPGASARNLGTADDLTRFLGAVA